MAIISISIEHPYFNLTTNWFIKLLRFFWTLWIFLWHKHERVRASHAIDKRRYTGTHTYVCTYFLRRFSYALWTILLWLLLLLLLWWKMLPTYGLIFICHKRGKEIFFHSANNLFCRISIVHKKCECVALRFCKFLFLWSIGFGFIFYISKITVNSSWISEFINVLVVQFSHLSKEKWKIVHKLF